MDQPLPLIIRVTFIVHLVVAIVMGLLLLLIPYMAVTWFGYPAVPGGLVPVLRSFGAMLLAFGGGTSYYSLRSKRWELIDDVVRSEIVYLALQAVVFLVSLVRARGPVFGNVFFMALSLVLLVLFVLTYRARPK